MQKNPFASFFEPRKNTFFFPIIFLIILYILQPFQPVSAATSTLSGYLDYPYDSANYPMRDSYFEVWKSMTIGTKEVGNGYTDSNGHFSKSFSGSCDCWVTAFSKNTAADVFCPVQSYNKCMPKPLQSATHHYDFAPIHVSDGQTVDYGTQTLPDGTYVAGAAHVADTILTAQLFIHAQTGTWAPLATVQFPCDLLCPGQDYFNPYLIHDLYIQWPTTPGGIIHEYGHWVMWKVYNGYWPPPTSEQLNCLTHYMNIGCGIHIGWTEGWAHFLAMSSLNNSFAMGWDLDNTSNNCCAFETGPGVEGQVAATLWDLYSPTGGSSDDHFGVNFASIYNTLLASANHPDSTFQDFYNDYVSRNPNNTWPFYLAGTQNTIYFQSPPTSFVVISCAPDQPDQKGDLVIYSGSGGVTCKITPLLGFSGVISMSIPYSVLGQDGYVLFDSNSVTQSYTGGWAAVTIPKGSGVVNAHLTVHSSCGPNSRSMAYSFPVTGTVSVPFDNLSTVSNSFNIEFSPPSVPTITYPQSPSTHIRNSDTLNIPGTVVPCLQNCFGQFGYLYAPDFSQPSGTILFQPSMQLKGSALPQSTITITDGYYQTVTTLGQTTSDSNGNWSFTLPNSLTSGLHTISATASNCYGSSGTGSSAVLNLSPTNSVNIWVGPTGTLFHLPNPQLGDVKLWVDKQGSQYAWGALEIENGGTTSLNITQIEIGGNKIPYFDWYADTNQNEVTAANFQQPLNYTGIVDAGNGALANGTWNGRSTSYQNPGIPTPRGCNASVGFLIMELGSQSNPDTPPLCLTKQSGSMSLQQGTQAVIYFEVPKGILTTANTGYSDSIEILPAGLVKTLTITSK